MNPVILLDIVIVVNLIIGVSIIYFAFGKKSKES